MNHRFLSQVLMDKAAELRRIDLSELEVFELVSPRSYIFRAHGLQLK